MLLLIAGIAIASGSVNPVIMTAAVIVGITAGAMLGREVFALVGRPALEKAATVLGFRKALVRVAARLQRGGWRAVFVARLIPGLRIQTTQVAGVTGMPRRDFLLGLLPSVVVYVAVFEGLGRLVGEPIVGLLHRAQHRLFVLAIFALLAVAVILSVRWLAEKGHLAVLEPIVLGVRRDLADQLDTWIPGLGGDDVRAREYPLVRRLWAGLIDLILVLAATTYLLIAASSIRATEVVLDPPGLLLLAAINVAYRVPLEARRGQTVGKRLMGISVYGPRAGTPGWLLSSARNLVGTLAVLWPIDLVLLLTSPRRQRLGDLVTGCTVRRVAH
ncbi:MAG TPA: RDD family protein [Candidatus Limnocylindrales bacterium]|nr:RDD family protein [Candidatus Limnocylindrales bacterium]